MPHVNQSRIKSYRRCPKQYEFKYIQGIQPKKPAPPLLRGHILHEMLNSRVQRFFKAPQAVPMTTPKGILLEYAKKYKSLFIEERERYGETFIEDIQRIFEGYVRTYEDEKLTYLGSEEFVGTDLAPDLRFVGTIDRRVQDPSGRHWLMESKSHKNIPGEENRFSDLQTVFYVWAWNRENKDRPIAGIIWDYLRTKPPRIPEILKNGQLSQAQNIDTDYHTYLSAIRENNLNPKPYEDFLVSLRQRSRERFYLRVKLPTPSNAMIESVVTDMRATAITANTLKVFPRNMTRDCSFCEYYRLCHAEVRGLDAAFVRKADYEEREPDDYGMEEEG